MSIFLIGLPGSGKTTLGAGLAARLGVPFCDMDQWIVSQSGFTVPQLFGQGEKVFRDWESRAVAALSGQDMVVACGGGAVLRQENRAMLRAGGRVVWIDRPVEDILGDVDISGRPLLAQGKEQVLALDQARRPLYRQTAHLRFHNRGEPEAAAEALWRLLKAQEA